jgi:hypothetical protein
MKQPPISRADAKAFGLKRFYTGQPCIRGHDAERYTASGACVECVRRPLAKMTTRELAAQARAERERLRRLRFSF